MGRTRTRGAVHEAGAALERRSAARRLRGRSLKLARHCLKAFFMFTLLGRGRMAQSELPAYFERVPCYREYNERFFRVAPRALAQMITGELLRAGVIAERDGNVIPT